MINQRVIYANDAGGVAIVIPAPNSDLTIKEIAKKSVPKGIDFEVVDISEIPTDRVFRNAWEKDAKSIKVNIDKAKEIQRNKWRNARKPILEMLDVEFIKALESGDIIKQEEVKAKKQALRDITLTDLSEIETPEELKNVWPEILI